MGYEFPGQPTKYKPEYCEELIKHMKSGYSYESFAAKVFVGISTLYNWEKAHPEFLEAKEIAFGQSLYHWENLLNHAIRGDERVKGPPAVLIYSMRARFAKMGWNVSNHDKAPPPKRDPIRLAYSDDDVIDVKAKDNKDEQVETSDKK